MLEFPQIWHDLYITEILLYITEILMFITTVIPFVIMGHVAIKQRIDRMKSRAFRQGWAGGEDLGEAQGFRSGYDQCLIDSGIATDEEIEEAKGARDYDFDRDGNPL